ncbi:hypothetical protein MOK15_05350 [Sphingobium sp. BYY-5]|uniref:hypothetical protein n=1 Tax=Sphingobium sp. BYY-5 TaxID=2926400 RepID=UPI001FA7C6A5|nr:hypothetical protein [Sphingobium sp. BYY-5]MCI4589517.1 hypothetical protein [Sphingobium sp. BYY-5]
MTSEIATGRTRGDGREAGFQEYIARRGRLCCDSFHGIIGFRAGCACTRCAIAPRNWRNRTRPLRLRFALMGRATDSPQNDFALLHREMILNDGTAGNEAGNLESHDDEQD